jgi:hypothetical protein
MLLFSEIRDRSITGIPNFRLGVTNCFNSAMVGSKALLLVAGPGKASPH